MMMYGGFGGGVQQELFGRPSAGSAATGGFRAQVTGPNRFRFFKRPVVPALGAVPPEVLLTSDAMAGAASASGLGAPRPPSPPVKTVGVQTLYRESEAQTDPFTSDYVVPEGSGEPEVLTLSSLQWGKGLPAGKAEIEMIERARQRRAFEASLPDIGEDPDTWRDMMEQQEFLEFKEREAKIKALQAERLAMIQNALDDRSEKSDFLTRQRLEELRSRLGLRRDKSIGRIQKSRIQLTRKLAKKRRAPSMGPIDAPKRDIIMEYASYSSTVYAPIAREGAHTHGAGGGVDTSFIQDLSYKDICNLEASMSKAMMSPTIKRPPLRKYKSLSDKRKAAQLEADLARVEATLGDKKVVTGDNVDLSAYKKAAVIERPPTPVLDHDSGEEEEEERRCSSILLQRLLRGRGEQAAMWSGKEARLELIRELRSAEDIVDDSTETEAMAIQEHKKKLLQGSVAASVGEAVGSSLDYLTQELVRFKEEQRIHAMVLMAERQRRAREAAESGRRAEEEARRAKEDVVFREVMGIHNGTVDSYLEHCVAEAVDEVARATAVRESSVKAEFINDVVEELEKNESPESLVADLMTSFLYPEVSRMAVASSVAEAQKSSLLAAHSLVYGSLQEMDKN